MTERLRYLVYQGVFGVVHVSLALPSVYLLLGLPLILREAGWSGTQIGSLQLAGLPAVFKLVLALPVDGRHGGGGRYRLWGPLLCAALAVVLAGLARVEPGGQVWPLFGLALLASLFAVWADVPANGLAIRVFPEPERLRAGGVRSAALFLAAITGGGLLVVVNGRWGWPAPFLAMASLVIVAGTLLAAMPDPGDRPTAATRAGLSAMVCGYFRQPGAAAWTAVLVSVFPFIGAAWLYTKPMLLDFGLARDNVAWLAGVGGGVIGAVASLAASGAARRLGVYRVLPAAVVLAVVALTGLTLAAMSGQPRLLLAAAALVAVATGCLSAVVFGLQMYFTRPGRRAADYGMQASLFTATRLTVPAAAGVLLDQLGYPGMLTCLTIATGSALLLVLANRDRIASVVGGAGSRSSP